MKNLISGYKAKEGEIIGWTKSGKVIRRTVDSTDWNHPDHNDYTIQDHRDAAKLTNRLHDEAIENDDDLASELWNQNGHHRNMIDILKKENKEEFKIGSMRMNLNI